MSDPRTRRIDARPATAEVAEYRALAGSGRAEPPADAELAARELVQLCRFRNRPALLRNNLLFGRSLSAIRAADLDGDGQNELLVLDNDRTIHTLRYQRLPDKGDAWPGGGAGAGWVAGAHRYRGRMLGLSCTGFGVFHRQEAIVTSVEDHPDGSVYHELKLTCDGVQWDVSELVHRRAPSQGEGEIRLIGESGEPGRVPVLRAQGGRLLVEILDDRAAQPEGGGAPPGARVVAELSREISSLVLCDDELVVAYARGGIQRIVMDGPGGEGRLRPLLFPNWRFSSLAYAPPHLLGGRGPAGGLLCGGTTFGYVFAIDLRRGGVLWRMDAGFLFSCMALADVESRGRVDLLLGGMDGGLRIYELTDGEVVEERCRRYARSLGAAAPRLLDQLAPPGHDAHAAVALFRLSQILDATGAAQEVLVQLLNWFTAGQPGWHTLPERAQREAVAILERYLLLHVPHLSTGEPQSTVTGPLPLVDLDPEADPKTGSLLTRTILAELVEVYLAAPRLVRRQIDRISRRLAEQFLHGQVLTPGSEVPLPELQRLLNVRGLRAREYAHTLAREAEAALRREASRPPRRSPPGEAAPAGGDVLLRVLRAVGLVEEARLDRFSMEFERLDLGHAVTEPLPAQAGGPSAWVAGLGRDGMLRVEPLPAAGNGPAGEGGVGRERPLPGNVRFVESRRILSDEDGHCGAALLVGMDERGGTRLLLFDLGQPGRADGAPVLRSEAMIGPGAEPIGFDRQPDVAPEPGSPPLSAAAPEDVLLLRVPPGGTRDTAAVLAVDAPGGRLRVREHLYPDDLLQATANDRASLQITASRVTWRARHEGQRPGAVLAAQAPAGAERACLALSEDGQLLGVGTTSGLVQLFSVSGAALVLEAQYLLPKGVSALCFVPAGVFGAPAVAIGTEDELVHLYAVGEDSDGLELARLAVGGAPQRMTCLPIYTAGAAATPSAATLIGHRLMMVLSGGVVAAWDAPAHGGEEEAIAHLLGLAARAAGSRQAALAMALRGPGPHARAVAVREVIAMEKEAARASGDVHGRTLRLLQALLGEGEAHPAVPGESLWPLPRPERDHIVLAVLCAELVPLSLGEAHPDAHRRLARELLQRVVLYCDDPLAIRADLLSVVEEHARPEHVVELLGWLPRLVLRDARSATWPFSIDSVGALFLRHLKRMDHAHLFDDAEPYFFRHVALVLESVLPSQPSRFLLTEVALLLRAALDWGPAQRAGNLGRARLYLPHSVIAALCQPALLPDEAARRFLFGVSRRWGPRMTMLGSEEEDGQAGIAGAVVDSEQLGLYLDWIVEDGFDELYYERLADELARFTTPALPGQAEPDAWALADTVQAVLRLFDFGNLAELQASLQPAAAARSLEAIRSHRGRDDVDPFHRYRDAAWAFLDEEAYEGERAALLEDLQRMDRKCSGARLARNLDEVAARLDERRGRLRGHILGRLAEYAPPGGAALPLLAEEGEPAGALVPLPDLAAGEEEAAGGELFSSIGYAGRILALRPTATVLSLLNAWWRVLIDEASRLRTEADFDVRLVADLGVAEGRRALRYAVVLSPDTNRPARDVVASVLRAAPAEVHARVQETQPVDLEHGKELSIFIECPAQQAADGMKYSVELELRYDEGKRTERVIEGHFARDAQKRARSLFDGFADHLLGPFAARARQLQELLEPAQAAVVLVSAFPAHAYELLGEVLGLEWPDRPLDTLEGWRMVNLAARQLTGGGGGAAAPPLRDILQQVGARLGTALGLDGAERLDTVEALLRAVAEAPPQTGPSGAARGLLILGLPELCEKARLEDTDQRQLLGLGARLCLAFRGRALALLSPQAAALSLGQPVEFLDLDHVADPLSQGKYDERARGELARALHGLLGGREHAGGASPPPPSPAQAAAVAALIDATGTDLRLIAECLPLVEQSLRERARNPPGVSAFEGRVGNYMNAVWAALPLPHRLYLAALCSDTVELDVGDLRPGMVVDQPVNSISGKDRLPTSKVVVAAGVRLDARAVDDLNKVMWLKKVRVRGSFQDSRTVLWTYLRQPRPGPAGGNGHGHGGHERWLEPAAADLRRLGLVRQHKIAGERALHAFTSPPVREWLRSLLGLNEGEAGLCSTIDGRNLVRQLPLWDAATVDKVLGGNSAQLRAVLGWSRSPASPGSMRWPDFLELARACRKWMDGQEEPRFIEALARYFRLDLIEGTAGEGEALIVQAGEGADGAGLPLRSVQVRFRDQRQLPWLKRVVMFLPTGQPDRHALDQVQLDLRARLPAQGSSHSGPHYLPPRPDRDYSGAEWTISDSALSAIVVVPEISAEVVGWGKNRSHIAIIDVADLQHAALHESPVEELIRRLAAAASYAALSPFRSKMGLANQELIEEMFYGRRALLEEIRGQRQENFIIVGPRKIGKTSLLQRVRLELEQQGYRVIPRGMDYTTAPDSRELLRAMIADLAEDLEPRGPAGALHGHGQAVHEVLATLGMPGAPQPALRQVVDLWAQRHPDRSIAIVLDEIDTILRTERRAYLLGEWREAWTLGEALASLLPRGRPSREGVAAVRQALQQAGFPRDVVEGVAEGLQTEPHRRKQAPLLEELRSASALVLRGGAVCRVILAGHAELSEARLDLFGPLLNFAKLRFLGALDETSAERMVREPFARLGLRFENAAAEQLLLQQTFRVPAWIQHCGALIIQSIDERLRSSRREEQKITERDVLLAVDRVHAEERAALQSENGLYMLGPECSFVLFALSEEAWFTVDLAVQFLHDWYVLLDYEHRKIIGVREQDWSAAFSPEVVMRILRDLTNTFYIVSDEAAGQASAPGVGLGASSSAATPGTRGALEGLRDRMRRSYKVSTPIVRAVFRDELNVTKLVELARRGMRLWQEGRGVWARTAGKGGL